MARLLADYLARYDATLVCLQQSAESAELRDATVLENFNWANWHLNSVLQPALIQLDSCHLKDCPSKDKGLPRPPSLHLQPGAPTEAPDGSVRRVAFPPSTKRTSDAPPLPW